MSGEVFIEPEEIQILLNLLDDPTVSYPLYNLDLVIPKVDREGYSLRFSNREELDDAALNFGGHKREMPVFDDIRSSLITSGVLPFENMDQIEKMIRRYRSSNMSVKFSLDTNMLYYNFTLNYDLVKREDMVIVDIVREELMNKLDRKYLQGEINQIEEMAPYNGRLFKELVNRRRKEARKANIGLRDWDHLKGHAQVIEKDGSGKPDKVIVETLERHAEEMNTNVVLITADDAMIGLCKAADIAYIKCDLPYEISSVRSTFQRFNRLICDLAWLLGVIKVGPVVLYGEYRGYSSNHPDRLKVVDEYAERSEELKKELGICRKLRELEIER